jgi:hypothetical protein
MTVSRLYSHYMSVSICPFWRTTRRTYLIHALLHESFVHGQVSLSHLTGPFIQHRRYWGSYCLCWSSRVAGWRCRCGATIKCLYQPPRLKARRTRDLPLSSLRGVMYTMRHIECRSCRETRGFGVEWCSVGWTMGSRMKRNPLKRPYAKPHGLN